MTVITIIYMNEAFCISNNSIMEYILRHKNTSHIHANLIAIDKQHRTILLVTLLIFVKY